MEGKFDTGSKWVVDLGATDHITHRLDWFNNDLKNTCELPVTIPNGSSIPVEGRGSCTLSNGIQIKNVLHVPTFTCNLLSVSRLANNLQCAVTFFPEFCVMHALNSRRLIGAGKCKNGLYQMSMVGSERKVMATTSDLWHKRLGHASHGKLYLLDFVKNDYLGTNEVIENKTPYKIVYGQKPDYANLKVFGCLAYYRSTETRGDKFEERGRPGIFLGYPRGTKGYKIYDVKNGKIIVSRDVRFFENTFLHDLHIDQEEDEEPEIFEFPTWYYDDQNPHKNMSNIREEKEPEPDSQNNIDNNVHESDVMQIETNSDNVPQDEGSTHVAEPTAQIENIGQVNVTKPMNQTETEQEEPTREKRTRTRPARLKDYVVNLPPSIDQASPDSSEQSSTIYPIANFISYDKFSDLHKAFLTAISINDEPKTFKQAAQDENWRDAMKKEIQALETKGTWTLEDLPEGK
ncbi:uncharacterized protein LOC143567765 [Bidens hawaiensis]|uniref:uncharacterized protein LOC143567765 n=1 Tax=Bidens hawaiensis TaxID=980011 RepID=UPI00404930D8